MLQLSDMFVLKIKSRAQQPYHMSIFYSISERYIRIFLMLVASFCGLYCFITHLHVLSMSTSITYEYATVIIVFIVPLLYFSMYNVVFQLTHTYTHIQDIHNIAGPLVSCTPQVGIDPLRSRELFSDHCSTSKQPRLDISVLFDLSKCTFILSKVGKRWK